MYLCTCKNGTMPSNISNCTECSTACDPVGGLQTCMLDPSTSTKAVAGVSVGVFLGFLILSIILWVLIIWFSIHVMRKCRGKPKWLNPTVITLLVLFFLLGWLPGLGLLFFIALLVILIVYNQKCKKL